MNAEKKIYSTRCFCASVTLITPNKQDLKGQTGRLIITNLGLRFEGDDKNTVPNFSYHYEDISNIDVMYRTYTTSIGNKEVSGKWNGLTIKTKQGNTYDLDPPGFDPREKEKEFDWGHKIYWIIKKKEAPPVPSYKPSVSLLWSILFLLLFIWSALINYFAGVIWFSILTALAWAWQPHMYLINPSEFKKDEILYRKKIYSYTLSGYRGDMKALYEDKIITEVIEAPTELKRVGLELAVTKGCIVFIVGTKSYPIPFIQLITMNEYPIPRKSVEQTYSLNTTTTDSGYKFYTITFGTPYVQFSCSFNKLAEMDELTDALGIESVSSLSKKNKKRKS